MDKELIKLAFTLGYQKGCEDLEKAAQRYVIPEADLDGFVPFETRRALNKAKADQAAAAAERKVNLRAKAKARVTPTNLGGGSMNQLEALNRQLLEERIRHGRATKEVARGVERNKRLVKNLFGLNAKNRALAKSLRSRNILASVLGLTTAGLGAKELADHLGND